MFFLQANSFTILDLSLRSMYIYLIMNLLVLSYFSWNIALWDIYGIKTPLIVFFLFMGFVMTVAIIPSWSTNQVTGQKVPNPPLNKEDWPEKLCCFDGLIVNSTFCLTQLCLSVEQNMSISYNYVLFCNWPIVLMHPFNACALTLWEPAYDIFVLWFRPKTQQFSVALPTP